MLTIPSYGLLNVNAHYDGEVNLGLLQKFSAYVEVRNIIDQKWVASANNLTNRVANFGPIVAQNGYFDMAQNATGSIYAGNPRMVQGGVKFKF